MRLVEPGQGLDLDEPVRTYLPEFKLRDEDVAAKVTVLQLLNHTAGWEGDMMDDTGDGDDSLEKYVARMERLQQVSPLGATVSYNNASLSVARPHHRAHPGDDVRESDPRPAARAARDAAHVLLPERDHDPAVRGRSPARGGRHHHDRPAVGAAARQRTRRWHVRQRSRPDRVGEVPSRRRHGARRHAAALARSCSARMQQPTARHAGQRARRLRRHQLAARAISPASGWSVTAARRTGSTPTSRWCRSAASPASR